MRRTAQLNMMVAIILEEFQLSQKREEYRLKEVHTDAFIEAWAEHDPYATGKMSIRHLRSFIRALPPPLGLNPCACMSPAQQQTGRAWL